MHQRYDDNVTEELQTIVGQTLHNGILTVQKTGMHKLARTGIRFVCNTDETNLVGLRIF